MNEKEIVDALLAAAHIALLAQDNELALSLVRRTVEILERYSIGATK